MFAAPMNSKVFQKSLSRKISTTLNKSEAFEFIPFFNSAQRKLQEEINSFSTLKVIPKGSFISNEGTNATIFHLLFLGALVFTN